MAETQKPATSTRKKTTKRGPTKAAALKALGLTQEDLDTLKKVAEARTASDSNTKRDKLGEVVGHKLAHMVDCTVEDNVVFAPENEAASNPDVGPFFVRNLRGPEIRFRLTRQQDKNKKATVLKPRGQRGDFAPLQPEDLQDSELLTQVEIGLVEIITAGEAKEIIKQQSTNQRAPHAALSALRNELGEPYEAGAVRLDPEFNSQGVTVAQLNPQGGGAGALPELGRTGVDWAAIRSGQQPEQGRAIGGNPAIISDGFAAARADVAQDAIARSKNLEGPAAGGVNRVVVEPTQKS